MIFYSNFFKNDKKYNKIGPLLSAFGHFYKATCSLVLQNYWLLAFICNFRLSADILDSDRNSIQRLPRLPRKISLQRSSTRSILAELNLSPALLAAVSYQHLINGRRSVTTYIKEFQERGAFFKKKIRRKRAFHLCNKRRYKWPSRYNIVKRIFTLAVWRFLSCSRSCVPVYMAKILQPVPHPLFPSHHPFTQCPPRLPSSSQRRIEKKNIFL